MTPFSAAQIREASSVAQAAGMVRENLRASDAWLVRGLLAIFQRQTADEQSSEYTKHHNSIGFNGLDGNLLTSFAKQVLTWQATPSAERRHASPLSPKQLELTRRKMLKYARQLAEIAREAVVA